MKLGRWMQNDKPITTHKPKSKPEVEFQYGDISFSKIGSSFVSAVHRDLSSRFDMQMDIHLLKQVPSLNLNPEIDF